MAEKQGAYDVDDVIVRNAGLRPRMFLFDGASMLWILLFVFNPGVTSFYLALVFIAISSFLERNFRISVGVAFGMMYLTIVTIGFTNKTVTTVDMVFKRWLS